MRIIFLGTPDFAVASLKALVENNFNVVAVVTAPDKPAGRGMKLQSSAVKNFAVEHQIPVLQPEKLKNESFIQDLKSYRADIQVVVAFRMLPEMVWNMPKLGTVNVHASLLPNYRGAAPINWAVINGETETGVTTFKLKHEIDTGDILDQQKVSIEPADNAGILHDKLMISGATLLVDTLRKIERNQIEVHPQISNQVTKHAPKIFTQTCEINWENDGANIHNLIRGLSPYPAAFAMFNHKKVKIFESKFEHTNHNLPVGEIVYENNNIVKIACKDGFIHILMLQMEGKTKMKIEDFLRGNKL